jgi:hypothetical protein
MVTNIVESYVASSWGAEMEEEAKSSKVHTHL